MSDPDTVATILQVWFENGYLLDPHAAVAYAALLRHQAQHPDAAGILLATAHPVKFPGVLEPIIGQPIELPEAVRHLQGRPKQAIPMAVDFGALKEFLLR
ncbi:hypothetical protein [Hymenobacter coccineus]|uniref:Threonine synthase n=1 Tax=Hymenobacter coccineus TaxID=1908235 RepID=A0A1G1SVB4_9BACT|nr:hypothetical protein [Hymenobacter coccineus]OGX82536.1 hypothetical protein BEN49_13490 [Hymenobacter coccineus]